MTNSTLKHARMAVLAAFFINGAALATWVSRIPSIQIKLSLTEGALGLVLMGLSSGVLVGLFFAGGLAARFGSSRMTVWMGVCATLTMLPLTWANSPVVLWVNLFLFGASISVMDVSMNDQAVMVEREAGRPLMSSFHATFSIGGLVGALVGAGMAASDFFSTAAHFGLVGVVLIVGVILSARSFLPTEPASEGGPTFRLPERALWMLGLLALCAAVAEGAMADWSAVYLNQVLLTSTSIAALGYAGFSATMTLGRLLGDGLLARFQPKTVVRVGGILASTGFGIIILTSTPWAAMAGFALIGLGLSNIIPIAFSTAGNAPGISSSTGIAGVATIAYAGFLAGPPVIGLVAEQTSLRTAFVLVGIMVASLIMNANSITARQEVPAD